MKGSHAGTMMLEIADRFQPEPARNNSEGRRVRTGERTGDAEARMPWA